MTIGLGCWLCGGPDHWQASCDLLEPAATLAGHQRRIQLFIDRWAERRMSTAQKRDAVENEYRMWNERKAKRPA